MKLSFIYSFGVLTFFQSRVQKLQLLQVKYLRKKFTNHEQHRTNFLEANRVRVFL